MDKMSSSDVDGSARHDRRRRLSRDLGPWSNRNLDTRCVPGGRHIEATSRRSVGFRSSPPLCLEGTECLQILMRIFCALLMKCSSLVFGLVFGRSTVAPRGKSRVLQISLLFAPYCTLWGVASRRYLRRNLSRQIIFSSALEQNVAPNRM